MDGENKSNSSLISPKVRKKTHSEKKYGILLGVIDSECSQNFSMQITGPSPHKILVRIEGHLETASTMA